MRYKIVQKKYFDEYDGEEAVKFYIKKRSLLGIWYYVNLSLDKIERIFGNIIIYILSGFIPLLFLPLFTFFKIGVVFFLTTYILSYFSIKYIGCLISRRSYSYLESAKDDIIKELKRIEFKNETVDVIEISTSKNKIIVAKNYDNI